jgi:hypothetical protein
MLRYLLDANVVIKFQQAGLLDELAKAAVKVPLAIVDDVRDELTVPKTGKSTTADMRAVARVLDDSSIELLAIEVPSPQVSIRKALLARKAGLGEAGSVAIASQHPNLIFVTEDAKAVEGKPKLYRELPGETGRILGLHAFLRVLVERGAIAADSALGVSTAAKTISNIDPPLWWRGWVDALPPRDPDPRGGDP